MRLAAQFREYHMSSGQTSKLDPELYCFDLDWWLNCRDAACGYRSSFAAQIAAIERGGGGGAALDASGAYIHPYHDGHVRLGPARHGSAFATDRRILPRWLMLALSEQNLHIVHYVGVTPRAADSKDRRQRWAKGVESRLGRFAAVALYLAAEHDDALLAKGEEPERLKKLLIACEKGDEVACKAHAKRAESRIRLAHRAFYAISLESAMAWVEKRDTMPGIQHVKPESARAWSRNVDHLDHSERPLNFDEAEA